MENAGRLHLGLLPSMYGSLENSNPLVSQVLYNRGLHDSTAVSRFVDADTPLADPYTRWHGPGRGSSFARRSWRASALSSTGITTLTV